MMKPALRALANRQHGYFSAQQARDVGYVRQHHVDHVHRGNWISVDRGLFRLPGYPDTLESDFIRWSFWTIGRSPSKQVVVSHDSALFYYNLRNEQPTDVHLTVPIKLFKKEEKPGCVFHREELNPGEVVSYSGYKITTPVRTLQDMKPMLLLISIWAETVQLAHEKNLIDLESSHNLLGNILFQQVGSGQSWARPTEQGASAGYSGELGTAGMLPSNQRKNEIRSYGFRMRTERSSEWYTAGRSFTLVEMLVVIAILAVLAGILMPSLHKALEQARLSYCQNNCKQLGIAMGNYLNDFDGYFPCSSYANAVGLLYPNGWNSTPFSNHFKVLGIVWVGGYLPPLQAGATPPLSSPAICPSLYPDWCTVQWATATGGYIGNHVYIRGGTYGFNNHLDRSMQMMDQTIRPNLKRFIALKKAGKRFVFSDSSEQSLRVVIARAEDYLGQSAQGCEPNWIHGNATNFLFCDGHVQAFQRERLPEVMTSTGWASAYPLGTEGNMPEPW